MPPMRSILTVTLLLVALAGAAALGFEAGRRYPFDSLRWLLPTDDRYARWEKIEQAPFTVYEAGVAVHDGKVFVFGGFHNTQIQASSAVWVFDPATRAWTRRRDLPSPFTHANAAVAGDRIWFAGGFIGDSPGPATANVWRYDPATDGWEPGPPLPAPRGGGALVHLNGKLHYFGGYAADRETSPGDHWVLDLAAGGSGRWESRSPLPVPRGHLSGAGVGGYLYALGGCIRHDPYPLDVPHVHRYDPTRDAWDSVASLPTPRSHFEPSTLMWEDRIVIVGGRSRPTGAESVEDVTAYDPETDRWMALPPLPIPLHSPIAAVVDDRILVGVGGVNGSRPTTRDVWLSRFDPGWERGPDLPVALGEVAAGVVDRFLVLVGQGSAATLAYDLGARRWEPIGRFPSRIAPGDHHGAEAIDGELYLIGGLGRSAGQLQIFNARLGEWRMGPPMPFAAGSAATAVIGGKLFVAGGIVGDTTTRRAARYDPASGTWSPIAPMPLARNHAASATDGRRLFVFGGRGPGSGDANRVANGFDDVQIYDPATDRWTVSGREAGSPARLPVGRGGMGKAVFAGGEFYVFGGETLDGTGATRKHVYTRVDIYDPNLNRWRVGPPMPTGRHGIFPVLVGDRVLIAGGGTTAGSSLSSILESLWVPRRGSRVSVGGR